MAWLLVHLGEETQSGDHRLEWSTCPATTALWRLGLRLHREERRLGRAYDSLTVHFLAPLSRFVNTDTG